MSPTGRRRKRARPRRIEGAAPETHGIANRQSVPAATSGPDTPATHPRCAGSAIDRAGSLYTFFRITLPLVAPILMIAIIFRTMEAFKTFDLAYILTSQPTTEVISIRLYKMAFQEWQTGRSSALAYIVLIVVVAITNIYVKYLNKAKAR